MRRWHLVVGLSVVAVSIGLYAAIVAVGLRLAAPRPSIVGPVPEALAGAEAVAIPVPGGGPIHGWWLPGSGRGNVLLLHGIWESRLRMVRRAEVLRREGYGVLLIDLRAHGEAALTGCHHVIEKK